MMKEERVLFPMIAQGFGSHAGDPIAVMEMEHNEAGEQLETIKALTNNLTPPEGACTTARALHRHRSFYPGFDAAYPRKIICCSHARCAANNR